MVTIIERSIVFFISNPFGFLMLLGALIYLEYITTKSIAKDFEGAAVAKRLLKFADKIEVKISDVGQEAKEAVKNIGLYLQSVQPKIAAIRLISAKKDHKKL